MVQCTSSTQTNHFPVADAILSIVLTTHFVLPYLTTCTTWYAHPHSPYPPFFGFVARKFVSFIYPPASLFPPVRWLPSNRMAQLHKHYECNELQHSFCLSFFFAVNVCICHALARTGLSLWWIFSKSSEWTLNGTRTEKNSCSVGNWIFCAWFGAFAIFARLVALAFCCAEYFCVTHHSDGLNANENKKHFKLKKTARRMLNEAQEWHSVFVCVLWVCWVNETTKYRFAKSLDLKDISSI